MSRWFCSDPLTFEIHSLKSSNDTLDVHVSRRKRNWKLNRLYGIQRAENNVATINSHHEAIVVIINERRCLYLKTVDLINQHLRIRMNEVACRPTHITTSHAHVSEFNSRCRFGASFRSRKIVIAIRTRRVTGPLLNCWRLQSYSLRPLDGRHATYTQRDDARWFHGRLKKLVWQLTSRIMSSRTWTWTMSLEIHSRRGWIVTFSALYGDTANFWRTLSHWRRLWIL